ncbi:hypothetical protein Y032_0172g347 [Ancylostoma ceylanicum]|uniref:Uncharacterized protein n=1 Tax=Ancylostoma ceylanicum TaxID=53326 RepID=A0A016SVJ2_9BILA|nr:hypothetical protein Y032_0172g347 [Ancylostoma ceylanicum]
MQQRNSIRFSAVDTARHLRNVLLTCVLSYPRTKTILQDNPGEASGMSSRHMDEIKDSDDTRNFADSRDYRCLERLAPVIILLSSTGRSSISNEPDEIGEAPLI